MHFAPNERVAIDFLEDGIAHVRLTRADKMNALDPEMFDRIAEAGAPAVTGSAGTRERVVVART